MFGLMKDGSIMISPHRLRAFTDVEITKAQFDFLKRYPMEVRHVLLKGIGAIM